MEWDNGTPVTVEEVKRFKLKQFVKVIKEFSKKDDLMDFFGVAELMDMDQKSSKNGVTEDTATHANISTESSKEENSTAQ